MILKQLKLLPLSVWTATAILTTVTLILDHSHTASAITYGTPAPPGETPYSVQLQLTFCNGSMAGMCGGALVSPNMVITAGHCVRKFNWSTTNRLGHGLSDIGNVRVIAGEHSEWGRLEGVWTQTRFVKQVILHPRYARAYNLTFNDIALLVLTHPFKITSAVSPIQIPTYFQFPFVANFSGWGGTEHKYNTSTNVPTSKSGPRFLKTTFEYLRPDKCLKMMEELLPLVPPPEEDDDDSSGNNEVPPFQIVEQDFFMCALGFNQSGTCSGDSGSPLVCKDEYIDISSNLEPYLCGISSGFMKGSCGGPSSSPFHAPSMFAQLTWITTDWIINWTQKHDMKCDIITEFNCGDGVCIPASAQCDGVVDCALGTDERGCFPCDPAQFRCTSPVSKASSRVNIKSPLTSTSRPRCIETEYVCDGVNDCGGASNAKDDGGGAASDELGCGSCNMGQFWCDADGTVTKCIDKALVCDGVKNCHSGRDEYGCGDCLGMEFRCSFDGRCVQEPTECDYAGDDEDELGSSTCLRDEEEEAEARTTCKRRSLNHYAYNVPKNTQPKVKPNCHRGLKFLECLATDGCAFNKERRECMVRENIVWWEKAKGKKGAPSASS